MRLRNVVYDKEKGINKVVWFGSYGRDSKGNSLKAPNYVEVKQGRPNTIEDIKEYKRIEIINSLSVLRGEIAFDRRFGVGLLEKLNKEMLDIEIIDILKTRLSLLVTNFESKQEGRNYSVFFEATTPEGVELDINYNYNFLV